MREAAQGVELLLSASLLHRRCATLDDDEPDAGILEVSVSSTSCSTNLIVVVIQTCIAAAVTMFSTDKSENRRKSHTLPQPDSDSPKPIDMLVDVLIGFLEKSTSYLRAMANKIFLCIASAATETTIDLIVAVSNHCLLISCTSADLFFVQQLERRNPADLIADEEDETESTTSEDDDEDIESSDEDNESDMDDSSEAALELRMKIEDALKANGAEATIGDTDEESEEEMVDDEQMMAIDEHLAEVFRSRSGDSKQSKSMANHHHHRRPHKLRLPQMSMHSEKLLTSRIESWTWSTFLRRGCPRVLITYV
jgi:DNA polymerase phi